MSAKLKPLPKFKNEEEERTFWADHDSAEYVDWSKGSVFKTGSPALHRSVKTISLRLTESMLNELRIMANERDVPYQSLIKMILQDRIEEELHS